MTIKTYFYHISLTSSQNKNCLRQQSLRNQNTYFMINNFFPENHAVYEIIKKIVAQPEQATGNNII
jgi:hypothetical protein